VKLNATVGKRVDGGIVVGPNIEVAMVMHYATVCKDGGGVIAMDGAAS
jgi:hypothetical protein